MLEKALISLITPHDAGLESVELEKIAKIKRSLKSLWWQVYIRKDMSPFSVVCLNPPTCLP
jgi:hypothetical protein